MDKLFSFLDILEIAYLSFGYGIVFLSNYLETSPLGWLIPGGILVALGGFFSYGGALSFSLILISASLGTIATLLTAYYIGKKTGLRLAKITKQENNVRRAEILLKNHGPAILTTSMLANFTRFWIAYVAGIHSYSIKQFIFYATIASFTWNTLVVGLGYVAGAERDKLEKNVATLGIVAYIFLFVALGVIYWKIDSEFKKENKK